MKVLFISSGLADQYGGAAVSESSLVKYLSSFCDVVVLCRKKRTSASFVKKTSISKNVRTYTFSDVIKLLINKRSDLFNLFESVDIVHINGHWKWENYIFARVSKFLNKPYVLHPRGMCLIGHRKVLLKKIFNFLIGNYIVKNAVTIICLSNFEKKHFEKYKVKKFKVIPNGVDVNFDSTEKCLEHASTPFFLYLGRIEARKNLLFLIKAFKKYHFKGGLAKLILIGPAERNYDRILFNACKKLEIEEIIKICGPIYDKNKFIYIHQSIAVIYPAYEEAFGRVPFEVLGIGSVPIVPDESGSAEYLFPIFKECIYEHDNEDDLVKKLFWAESLKDKFLVTKNAKNWVNENLNWPFIVNEFYNLYKTLT